ncbi:hypothetical protein L7F22_000607 [Adiantum nelumboides]|nr:hypothetical protein [Adiantum nelumboides]
MELILELCNLYSSVAEEVAHKDPGSLLHDFILHIVMGLSSSYSLSYSTGQTNSLHVLGLLLDSYCQYDSVMPPAIRSYPDFLFNLIAGLKLPGESLFLLYKISSFEEGIKQLLPFLPDLMNAAINTLVKTENDELRMNCIALLISMAQQSLISIRFNRQMWMIFQNTVTNLQEILLWLLKDLCLGYYLALPEIPAMEPFGLSKKAVDFDKYQAYELIHARWAMLEAASFVILEALNKYGTSCGPKAVWFQGMLMSFMLDDIVGAIPVFSNLEDIDFSTATAMNPIPEWELGENLQGTLEYQTSNTVEEGCSCKHSVRSFTQPNRAQSFHRKQCSDIL